MSKRTHSEESREERWLRKFKWYENKLQKKRRRTESVISQDVRDVQNEGN